MQSTPAHDVAETRALIDRLRYDPWSLSLDERRAIAAALREPQADWQARLPQLVEPPTPTASFPAFLLATERFRDLADAIGSAEHRLELDTSTADALQRFVDLYRNWLTDVEPT